MAPPGPPAVPRRLNGRPQACDPCRNRKVACDHGQPVCRRCIKRNQESECVYSISDSPRRASSRMAALRQTPPVTAPSQPAWPAPAPLRDQYLEDDSLSVLTQKRRQHRDDPGPMDIRTTSELPRDGPTSGQTSEQPAALHSSLLINSGSSSSASPAGPSATPLTSTPGYLGFTSYSSVFEEAKNSLSLLQGFQSWLPQARADRHMHLDASVSHVPGVLSSPTREMCLVALRGVPAPCAGQITNVMSNTFNWLRVAARRALTSLHDRFGTYLGACRIDSQLEQIALFLSNNTVRPFSEHEADPDKWIGQFTGANLRWESIGLIFTFYELSYEAAEKPRHESCDGSSQRFKEDWPEVLRVCLGLCMDLSRRFSSGNSLQLFLSSRRTVVESMHTGDAGE